MDEEEEEKGGLGGRAKCNSHASSTHQANYLLTPAYPHNTHSDLSDRSHVVLDYRKQGLQNGGGGVACGRSSHTAGEKKRIKP